MDNNTNLLIWRYKGLPAKLGETVNINGVRLLVTKRTNLCDLPPNTFVLYKVGEGFYFRYQSETWGYAGIEIHNDVIYFHGQGVKSERAIHLMHMFEKCKSIAQGVIPSVTTSNEKTATFKAAA